MLQEEWRGEIIQLSWEPRAYLLKGFMADDECEHLIKLASPGMRKSSVADNETGKSVDSQIRTSTGTFLGIGQTEIVERIEKRVAQVPVLISCTPYVHNLSNRWSLIRLRPARATDQHVAI